MLPKLNSLLQFVAKSYQDFSLKGTRGDLIARYCFLAGIMVGSLDCDMEDLEEAISVFNQSPPLDERIQNDLVNYIEFTLKERNQERDKEVEE